jgi:hypothetical protein
MEYDHLIVPGMNYRRPKDEIMKEVKAEAKEWHDKELKARVSKGGNTEEIKKKLDQVTNHWIELEFQRRMNWNYEEEGTGPLE